MTEPSSTKRSRAPVWFWIVFGIVVACLVAPPFFIKARTGNTIGGCIGNLKQINIAKEQWALENKKEFNDIPGWKDLAPYFKDGKPPQCPYGGTYFPGRVRETARCTLNDSQHSR